MASYHEELEARAAELGSDGCTGVPEFHRDCCLEHDIAYRTGMTLRGVAVTKAEADQRFRDCIQANSSFRWLSPLSWWRWLAVAWFGRMRQPPQILARTETPDAARRRMLREAHL